ncbi:unnamed protein product [Moneuplotes crassus]|uniref:Cyclin-like domain-containing protein n=1 Tax=Euplotes crassus TaxID=5936 RepID=A0AAD1USD6_EUPCR|nr:unnamed protein product [Moneuplotes crassus]
MAQFLTTDLTNKDNHHESLGLAGGIAKDSSAVFKRSSSKICKRNMIISKEISINLSQFSGKSIGSQFSCSTQDESSHTSLLLHRLGLADSYQIQNLNEKEIEIFDLINTGVKEQLNFSLSTIHLAFTLYLQFSEEVECSPIPTAVSCLLCAAKFNECMYDIPSIEELLKCVSKKEEIDQKVIQKQEILVLVKNDWNLLQPTLWKSCEHLLSKQDLTKYSKLLEDDIHNARVYAVPKGSHPFQNIYNKGSNPAQIWYTKSGDKPGLRRKRAKKKHSKSLFHVMKNFNDLDGYFKPSHNILEVPKKLKKRKGVPKQTNKLKMSRIVKISNGLSDILRVYEAKDLEENICNTSCTNSSYLNGSVSSVSEQSKGGIQNHSLVHAKRGYSIDLPLAVEEEDLAALNSKL